MLIIELEILVLPERCQSKSFMNGVGPHTGNKNWKIALDGRMINPVPPGLAYFGL